ncbi:AAA-like domain-containing protein [Mastigocoleus testarum]|uniref:Serine/threonine protein kinase n=1 Tax=Mastigocoleus testarum BC008 TaxID=371196 RepID=A0A0V8A0Z7_9CYAN|nr:AAA-like domain-containing protein [Mastigocoleus testarum]KST65396.1 hypothetical protein BC008_21625 [Mastigocoleus testarum BC008]KST70460.1 hypothetical protein BC008_45580 [Mastigocoleus testarum BC008]
MLTLKASPKGLAKIKKAREKKGWTIENPQWLVAASKLLQPEIKWEEFGPYADGVSRATFKRFLQGKEYIKLDAFKAFCQVLGLDWEEVTELEIENTESSPFYVIREPYESQCYEEIKKPGALIRIKAPEQMGKTLLLERILDTAREEGYQARKLDFQQADSQILSDYQDFLQWFCVNLTDIFDLEDHLDEYWKPRYGINRNCTRYFQKYILTEIQNPLVLGLDNLDVVFEQPAIFTDFCRLLRAWNDQSKQSDHIGELWKKMRLVLVHSTEVYGGMDINSSPLAGVGLPFELLEFTPEQVRYLAKQYELHWDVSVVEDLTAMLGGHPALICRAFDSVKNQNLTLEKLLTMAPTDGGIFQNHLGKHFQTLRKYPQLANALLMSVNSSKPVDIAPELAFKLHKMGLVKLQGNYVTPRCNLYRQYFSSRLTLS